MIKGTGIKKFHKFLPKTLASRLSILFFSIFLILAATQYLTLYQLWRRAELESKQRSEWGLAGRIATQLFPYLSGELGPEELEAAVGRIAFLNPRINIYFLDNDGYVLPIARARELDLVISGYGKEKVRVPTEILNQFLTYKEKRSLPLLGPSLAFVDEKTVFSAARIEINGKPGFLYVTLEGQEWILAHRSTEALYVVFGGAIFSATLLLLTTALGIWLLLMLTRRFKKITKVVEQIAGGDLSARNPSGLQDEIGELSQNINTMAARLSDTIQTLEDREIFRRNFMTSITHDLRNPISAIFAYLQRLEKKGLNVSESQLVEYLVVLRRNCERLDNYVEELFQASTLQSHEELLDETEFNLEEMLDDDIIPSIMPIVEASRISLFKEKLVEDVIIKADRTLLQRVFLNLLQNAIAYTQTGGKIVIGMANCNEQLEISVRDTGMGIPSESCVRLFEPFYRAGGVDSDGDGSGLGLFIVKQILDAHEIDIKVTSQEGVGTSFILHIPNQRLTYHSGVV